MTLTFATWNLNKRSEPSTQLQQLRELGRDIVALQEVSQRCFEVLRASDLFAWGFHALELRPLRPGEARARAHGCALIGTKRAAVTTEPALIEEAPAPEKTLSVGVAVGRAAFTVASLYVPPGSDRRNWGPDAKRRQIEAIAGWLGGAPRLTVVGIDANSPKVDHPDVERNEYWGQRTPRDRKEFLLHDPHRRPHRLRDAYRAYLEAHPAELRAIAGDRPLGPLAITFNRNRRSGGWEPCRYDFVFVSPDVTVRRIEHRNDPQILTMSDHGLVVAELSLDGANGTDSRPRAGR